MQDPEPRSTVGWDTTKTSRQMMMDELEDWALSLYEYPERMVDRRLWKEARTFSWNEDKQRFEHEPGCYDDMVMAMSGALIIDELLDDPVSAKRFERKPKKPKTLLDDYKEIHGKNNKKRNSFDVDSKMLKKFESSLP